MNSLFSFHGFLFSVNGFKGCGSTDNGKLLTNQSIDIDQALIFHERYISEWYIAIHNFEKEQVLVICFLKNKQDHLI